jgi:DNA-binding transcriptional regulator YiaG
LSLRRAHETLERLAAGESVAVELAAADGGRLRSELARLGILARQIRAPTVDVKSIREHFGLSQAEFAIRFGLEIDTVQNWEQGRNRPDQATQLLLKVIETYPDQVEAILTSQDMPASPAKRR